MHLQAVRDEILNIMHRNNIGEKRGTWMEDWHQKLHNNTTPDDVAICEAFIAFLESGADRGAYWSVLSDAGRCPLAAHEPGLRSVSARKGRPLKNGNSRVQAVSVSLHPPSAHVLRTRYMSSADRPIQVDPEDFEKEPEALI